MKGQKNEKFLAIFLALSILTVTAFARFAYVTVDGQVVSANSSYKTDSAEPEVDYVCVSARVSSGYPNAKIELRDWKGNLLGSFTTNGTTWKQIQYDNPPLEVYAVIVNNNSTATKVDLRIFE